MTLDAIGGPEIADRDDGSNPGLRRTYAYDTGGNAAYESDGKRTATMRLFDLAGRPTAQVGADGIVTELKWDAWDQPVEETTKDRNHAAVAAMKRQFTARGITKTVAEELDATGAARMTEMSWRDGGDLTTTRSGAVATLSATQLPTGVPLRASEQLIDNAGRVVATRAGVTPNPSFAVDGAIPEQEVEFAGSTTTYIGSLPNRITTTEPLAHVTYVAPGGYTSTSGYDEAGNALRAQRPGMNADVNTYDSRGLLVSHQDGGRQDSALLIRRARERFAIHRRSRRDHQVHI